MSKLINYLTLAIFSLSEPIFAFEIRFLPAPEVKKLASDMRTPTEYGLLRTETFNRGWHGWLGTELGVHGFDQYKLGFRANTPY